MRKKQVLELTKRRRKPIENRKKYDIHRERTMIIKLQWHNE